MTHYRPQGTVEAVLSDVLHNLAPKDVKQFTGKGNSHFYNIANPNSRWGLHLEDAAGLDAALITSGFPPKFIGLLETLTYAKVNGKASGVCLNHALRGAMACVGDLAREIDKALEDGKLDLHERRTLASLGQDLMDWGQRIRDETEPPHRKPEEVA